jgi:hypothetical protein
MLSCLLCRVVSERQGSLLPLEHVLVGRHPSRLEPRLGRPETSNGRSIARSHQRAQERRSSGRVGHRSDEVGDAGLRRVVGHPEDLVVDHPERVDVLEAGLRVAVRVVGIAEARASECEGLAKAIGITTGKVGQRERPHRVDLVGERLVVDPQQLAVVVELEEVHVEHFGLLVGERVAEAADEPGRDRRLARVDGASVGELEPLDLGVVLESGRAHRSHGRRHGSGTFGSDGTQSDELALFGESSLERGPESGVLGELDVEEGIRDVEYLLAVRGVAGAHRARARSGQSGAAVGDGRSCQDRDQEDENGNDLHRDRA